MGAVLRLLLTLVLLGTCSCQRLAPHPLSGRWLGESITRVDGPELATATGWVRGTSLEFSRGELTVTIPTELPRTAPFQVEHERGRHWLLAVTNPNGVVDRLALTLGTDELMHWHISDGREIVLRKQR